MELRFAFKYDGPRFGLDQVVHFAHDGVAVLLRIVRVVVDGQFRMIYGHDGTPNPPQVFSVQYAGRVLNVDADGGRVLNPGDEVSFGPGRLALASSHDLEVHGREIDGIPSDRQIRGEDTRKAMLERAAGEARACYHRAKQDGVVLPVVQVLQMDETITEREPGGLNIAAFEMEPGTLAWFGGSIADGMFGVVAVTTDGTASFATFPIEE